jgi:hypothetical protein
LDIEEVDIDTKLDIVEVAIQEWKPLAAMNQTIRISVGSHFNHTVRISRLSVIAGVNG